VSDERLAIASGELQLEGVLQLPEGVGAPIAGVVVCHPHPLYGGDMWNDVVEQVCRELQASGLAALRFNFRGVGGSQGEHGAGVGERDDVWAALDVLRSRAEIDSARLGLAGYSFGGGVALNAGPAAGVKALAAISAPPRMIDFTAMRGFEIPVLLIAGDRDEFAPADTLPQLAIALGAKAEVTIVPGADHFWWGHARELRKGVGEFFARALAAS